MIQAALKLSLGHLVASFRRMQLVIRLKREMPENSAIFSLVSYRRRDRWQELSGTVRQRFRRASEVDWNHYNPIISQLYLEEDRTLRDIMPIMHGKHKLKGT